MAERRQWFENALDAAGLSQTKLAEEANKILKVRYPDDEERRITQSSVSLYVLNKRMPRRYRIDAMDEVFQKHEVSYVKQRFEEEQKGA